MVAVMRLAFAALFLACALLTPTTLFAYTKHGSSWSYLTKPRVVTYSICDDGLSAAAKTRIKEAAALWNNGDKFKFQFDAGTCSDNPNWNTCGQKHVIDRGPLTADIELMQTPAAASAVCAKTDDKAKLGDCDIRISSSVKLYEGTGSVPADAYDLTSIVVHEFGHCVGLADQAAGGDSTSVMNPDITQGQKRRSLSADDIGGRNAIYP